MVGGEVGAHSRLHLAARQIEQRAVEIRALLVDDVFFLDEAEGCHVIVCGRRVALELSRIAE